MDRLAVALYGTSALFGSAIVVKDGTLKSSLDVDLKRKKDIQLCACMLVDEIRFCDTIKVK